MEPEILDRLTVGVLVLGAEGEERYRNPAVARAAAGTALADPGRFARRTQSLLQSCSATGKPAEERFEATQAGAWGTRVTAAPLTGGGAVLTFEALHPSEEVDERVRGFVAHLAHDLRTPMTSILGASDLLLSGRIGEPDERHARLLRIVGEGTQRLAALLSELTARFVKTEVVP